MVKKVCVKIFAIILLVFLILLIFSDTRCSALSDVSNDLYWSSWRPSINDTKDLTDKAGKVLGAITVIGVLVSIGTISIIGIKIMLGSAEEKAQYKQTIMPWVLGATMVFAVTTIPNIIYNVVSDLEINYGGVLSDSQDSGAYWESYILGYSDALEEAYSILQEVYMDCLGGKSITRNRKYK